MQPGILFCFNRCKKCRLFFALFSLNRFLNRWCIGKGKLPFVTVTTKLVIIKS